ncbi:mitotic-spindle organizing protein 2 isoform X2 [Alosa alosa]|uniref:mitotic-spindle organizing protein 2 isoform X2 n=1 Tax=Alosa alosa TaxID=278164 RepID=UPI0020154AF1|nr:mitotic-spindle organizing protein 2 isoform X2 [Alosa alosa]
MVAIIVDIIVAGSMSTQQILLITLNQGKGTVLLVSKNNIWIILDLLKMNVAPLAVFQTLKAMCVGQRLIDTSAGDSSSASVSTTHPETRVRTKMAQTHTEKGGRDGSSQRVPRQSSTSRGLKNSKSPGSSSSS